MNIWTAALLVIAMPVALASASGPQIIEPVTVPFTLEEISGVRPVVDVVVGELPYRMFVHSNAGLYLQLDPRHAAQAGVHDLKHAGAFGIAAPGKVSASGRDEGVLPRLAMGGRIWRDVPASVFEKAGYDATGMLGLQWITENRVVIDYAGKTLRIAPSMVEAAAREQALRRAGYAVLPMAHDARDGRYTVSASIGGVSRKMVISTVASLIVDQAFAKAAGLPAGPRGAHYGGPKGGVGYEYKFAKPVRLTIGGWTSKPTDVGSIQDTYAYISEPRPADPAMANGGQIGGDFLITHRAVVDFGNAKLYLR